MPYGKVDELAINTIRTLAVRLQSLCFSINLALPHHPITSYPAIAAIFFYSTRRLRMAGYEVNC
jgi:hypothetical protein